MYTARGGLANRERQHGKSAYSVAPAQVAHTPRAAPLLYIPDTEF